MKNETESALIGAAILDPSQIDIIQGIVAPDDFFDSDLAAAYALILDMRDAGEPINDMTLVTHRFAAAGILANLGGRAGLLRITQSTGSALHARYYASDIRRASRLRRLQSLGCEIANRCAGDSDPSEIAAWIESQIRACVASDSTADSVTIAQAAQDALHRIDEAARREKSLGIPSGLLRLDGAMGGFYPGELAILAARPSIGKSALAAQIAAYNAHRGQSVLFVSLEMSSHDIALRAIAGETGIDGRALRAGALNRDQRQAAQRYADSLEGVPFKLWAARNATVAKIRAAAKVQAATGGLALLVVDYLGLVHATDRRKPRWEQITEVSSDLKSLALEMDIPVLALCQLNREAERSAPRLDHLRDAGAIEQDADIVMLLHRESRDSESATLDVAKARNGVTGAISIGFDPATLEFTDAIAWKG
jgi:replicative DNA helicase